MIRILFPEPTKKDWKDWRKDCDLATQAVIESFNRGDKLSFSTKLYSRQKKEVYANEDGPFRGKCAYCETEFSLPKSCDIEHIRPKGKVTNEDDEEVMVPDGSGRQLPHPGYYWLAYDWRNLLPSCADCNRAENTADGLKLGKRNRFPIEGKHMTRPGEEKDENPLLLNPVIDDPENHIAIDESGIFFAKNGSKKGIMTIKVLGLNARDGLVRNRKKAIKEASDLFSDWVGATKFGGKEEKQKTETTINAIKLGRKEYSAAARKGLEVAKRDAKAFLCLLS